MLESSIKSLIKILEESKIDEIEISTFWGKQRIRLRKISNSTSSREVEIIQNNSDQYHEPIHNIKEEVKTKINKTDIDNEFLNKDIEDSNSKENIFIKAPLVGTFYNSPKPGEPPFISVGENIQEGQTICIIEAMKIFNEIESEYSGTVVEVLIKDGTPVEYDQDLIVISSE